MNKMKIYKYVQNEKTQKKARVKTQSYNSFTCYVSWVIERKAKLFVKKIFPEEILGVFVAKAP